MSRPDPRTLVSPFFRIANDLVVFLGNDFPLLGRQKYFPMRYTINASKGLTGLAVLAMMVYYSNYSMGAFIYFALHGSYAILWVTKDCVFGDPSWERPQTIGGSLNSLFVLMMYWYAPYHLISTRFEPSPLRACLSIYLTLLGSVLMMVSDAQKYFTLKYKRGLITDGLFSVTRNPNYLGEMMLYGGFALLSASWVSYGYLLFVWSLMFWSNMAIKDASLSRHPGWKEYSSRSWMLLPKFALSGSKSVTE